MDSGYKNNMDYSIAIAALALLLSGFHIYWTTLRRRTSFHLVRIDRSDSRMFPEFGLVNGGKLKEQLEIGYFHEGFVKNFLGLEGEQEVFHLHNNWVNFNSEFYKYNGGKITQAVKHKKKDIYGVLFHPEVRQKEMILEFAKL